MEAVAKLKNVPMSARKMRLVVDAVRGMDVDKALNALRFTSKEAATWVEKLLLSAIANWEYNSEEQSDNYDLFIKEAFVNEGSMLKRFRPAPHGRAHRIRKRTCHVHIILENRTPLENASMEDEGDENEFVEVVEQQEVTE